MTNKDRYEEVEEEEDPDDDMEYDYKTPPTWYGSFFLGLQHFISMCPSNAVVTLLLVNNLCLDNDDPIKSELISTSLFVAGITTFMQTICGCKLPIIQGSSIVLLIPCITMTKMPELLSCDVSNNTYFQEHFPNYTGPDSVFHLKIRSINGALMISSLVEILISVSGILKFLSKLISPLSLASMYVVLCMNISESLIGMMAEQWLIGIVSMVIIILINAVLAPVPIPILSWWFRSGFKWKKVKIFQTTPIIIALIFMWALCAILTAGGAFSSDSNGFGYLSRTDIKLNAISNAAIFKIPTVFQWGPPYFMPGIIVGLSLGIIVSVIESVGDYMVTGQVCRAPPIPQFATNRGLLVEGVGVLISGLLGSASGPTSFTGNIGILKITKAGNISISMVSGIFMIVCGMLPVVSAVLVAIPNAIVGGVIFVPIMMIMSCAISNLQHVNLLSARNGLVFGLSVTFGIYFPQWSAKNHTMLSTGHRQVDDIIQMILSISLFISFVISIVLDNVLPGHYYRGNEAPEEFHQSTSSNHGYSPLERSLAYDRKPLQWIATKWSFLQYLPLFPAYRKLKLERITKISVMSVNESNLSL